LFVRGNPAAEKPQKELQEHGRRSAMHNGIENQN
jgi:hypothetical protein